MSEVKFLNVPLNCSMFLLYVTVMLTNFGNIYTENGILFRIISLLLSSLRSAVSTNYSHHIFDTPLFDLCELRLYRFE